MLASVWDTIGRSILEGLKAFLDYLFTFLQDLSCTLIGACLDALPSNLTPTNQAIQQLAAVYSTVDQWVPLGFAIDLVCAYMAFYVLFYVLKVILMLF